MKKGIKTSKPSEQTVAKYYDLIQEVTEYEHEYYNLDKSSVSDSYYDAKYYEIQKLEEKYPKMIVPYSPTQRIGGVVSSGFDVVKHPSPMLSLDKRNDLELFIQDFITKNKLKAKEIIAEHKYDGLTLVLTYRKGLLVSAVTRGNGVEGEEVIHNARTIRNIPLTIPFKGKLSVRGEVIVKDADFNFINNQLKLDGHKQFATARNLASGSLRNTDPAVCASRRLFFQAYEIVSVEFENPDIEDDDYGIFNFSDDICLSWLSGYQKIPVAEYEVLNGAKAIEAYIVKQTRLRKNGKIPYTIDGLVFKINDIALRDEFGNGNKYPKWAMAYKFEDDIYETKLVDVVLQVSRTRRINPVAIIDPVTIDGTVVERATLNNFDFMSELQLGIGDTITVKKANEVIPNVVENITCSNSYKFPKTCPDCGAKTVKRGAYLYCSNKECLGANIQVIRHFASRGAMNIKGLSYAKIYDLVANGFVNDIWDLYAIEKHKRQIISMDGWGHKSYINLYASIDKSRNTTMERFLFSLGIPSLGYLSCCDLCFYCDWDIEKILSLNESGLTSIEGFGDKTAHAVYKGLHSDFATKAIEKFIYGGLVEFIDESVEVVSDKLEGIAIGITGSLSKTRDEFVEVIEANGGEFTDGIKKNTTHLLVGDNAGSKLEKAEQKGIKVITEKEFNKMIGG